jgi:hypothetical protein
VRLGGNSIQVKGSEAEVRGEHGSEGSAGRSESTLGEVGRDNDDSNESRYVGEIEPDEAVLEVELIDGVDKSACKKNELLAALLLVAVVEQAFALEAAVVGATAVLEMEVFDEPSQRTGLLAVR